LLHIQGGRKKLAPFSVHLNFTNFQKYANFLGHPVKSWTAGQWTHSLKTRVLPAAIGGEGMNNYG